MSKHDRNQPEKTENANWLPDPETIPSLPEKHKPLDLAEKQSRRKIPAEQRAEIEQAMEEIWAKRAELSKDLGSLAPDAERGKVLVDRLKLAHRGCGKVQALADYLAEQELLAGHEVMSYLDEVVGDIEHIAKKNPKITQSYEKVLVVVEQRREAIAAGIARAKSQKTTTEDKKTEE